MSGEIFCTHAHASPPEADDWKPARFDFIFEEAFRDIDLFSCLVDAEALRRLLQLDVQGRKFAQGKK